VSLFFYYKTGGLYVLLLIFSIIFNFTIAHRIAKSQKKIVRRTWLFAAVATNLFLLFYYKYTYLLVGWINELFSLNI
jgi:hypothetical protein